MSANLQRLKSAGTEFRNEIVIANEATKTLAGDPSGNPRRVVLESA